LLPRGTPCWIVLRCIVLRRYGGSWTAGTILTNAEMIWRHRRECRTTQARVTLSFRARRFTNSWSNRALHYREVTPRGFHFRRPSSKSSFNRDTGRAKPGTRPGFIERLFVDPRAKNIQEAQEAGPRGNIRVQRLAADLDAAVAANGRCGTRSARWVSFVSLCDFPTRSTWSPR